MRTFLISYDLAKPNYNKHVLAQEIMSLGERWARPLEQTWYVTADESEAGIEARLASLLEENDGMLIQAVDGEGSTDQHVAALVPPAPGSTRDRRRLQHHCLPGSARAAG